MIKNIFTVVLVLMSLASVPAYATDAKTNYATYCRQCHGIKGNGKGVNSPPMSVKPRNHTNTKEMSALTDTGIFMAIKEGGLAVSRSVLMPSWGSTFSDKEIVDLVAYLRKLCKCSKKNNMRGFR